MSLNNKEDGNVFSIHSGKDITPGIVNEGCVAALEEALEQAKSGEIVGGAIIRRHHDNVGSYRLVGSVGGYSMLGAIDCVQHDLTRVCMGEEEDD